jgi:hypothetical protein
MSNSDFLFARSDFWSGVASVIDIGGTMVEFNRTEGEDDADRRAIQADWNALKDDFMVALRPYEDQLIGSQD